MKIIINILTMQAVLLLSNIFNLSAQADTNTTPIIKVSSSPMTPDKTPSSSEWSSFNNTSWFEGSLFDYIIFLTAKYGWGVSIDPTTSVAAKLIESKVFIKAKPQTSLNTHLIDVLSTNGFLVKKTNLCGHQISFITTPERWNYYIALSYLQNGKPGLAKQNMCPSNCSDDENEGKLLVDTVERLLNNEKSLKEIEAKIKLAMINYNKRIADARLVRSSAEMSFTPSGKSHFESVARNEIDKARDEFTRANTIYKTFCDDCVQVNDVVLKRYKISLYSKNSYEAYFILDRLLNHFSRLKAINDSIDQARNVLGANYYPSTLSYGISVASHRQYSRTSDGVKAKNDYFQTEQNVNEMLTELRNAYTRALEKQKNGLTKMSSSDLVISEDLMSALNLDASLFGANVGVGYISVVQILAGLKQSLSQKILQKDEIHGELRRSGKAFRLHSLTQHSASGYEPALLETSIKGIAVSEGKGCIFPVIVQLEDRPKSVTTMTRTSYSPYWGAIYKDDAEIVTDAAPYTFTDYGEKDVYLRIMARQAYDWLVSQDENNKIKGKRLRIGFHEVFSSKSGDSASAAMAIAGFSAMNRKPIRQDVAITGSIRADGAIKAVGGVANKVSGAMNSPGIEIICIPQENIADLSTFSFEQLEKITIVAANNVKTYLKYCIFDEDSKMINSMLSNLHEAQCYLMTGDKDKAYSLLKSITANYPEVYSAQRLLELLERFGKGKEVRVQRWGDPL